MTDSPAAGFAEALRDRYVVERELGAGGMATVYLARDVRHHRRVALKVLRPELAAVIGARRFLQEIETTANLQHPHILPLHDSGEVGGTAFYVMPYVEGESLRDRLAREKQLPIEDAVRIATEVASALDYAHRKGIVHRDIKPENILLHDGQALVADFGIALAAAGAGGRLTETGLSLGTPHYMSPEQAMGEREITARSDVYALGCVVYEMLSGDPPFTGSTAQAVVARVVTEAPRPLSAQRHTVPPHLEAAVLRALEKVPADRFASAVEFARALASPGAATVVTARRPPAGRRRERLPWIVAGLLGLLLLGAAYLLVTRRAGTSPLVASLLPPPGCSYDDLSNSNLVQLSPDGRALAFVALCDTDQSLWVRTLGTGEMRRLSGTAGAIYPFWSPDSRSLGFFAAERLKRVDLESGAVRELAAAPDGRGGTWNADGVILYAPDIDGPLHGVPAEGGASSAFTRVSDSISGATHRLPYFLPDGKSYAFIVGDNLASHGELRIGRLGSIATRLVSGRASNVAYAGSHLLFVSDGVLLAQRFDPGRGTLSGRRVALAPRVEFWAPRYLGNFAVAGRRLIYRDAPEPEARIEWLSPRTGSRSLVLDRGNYSAVRLSPDGRRLVVVRSEGNGSLPHVWLYRLSDASWSRLSTRPSLTGFDIAWSHDGRAALLQPFPDTIVDVVPVDGGEVRRFPRPPSAPIALDWMPDGSWAVGQQQRAVTGEDITRWTGDSAPPEPLYATEADEDSPSISPDGRYLAYVSNATGREEVYLARLPRVTGHVQVSSGGISGREGYRLAWSPDGRTLYYIDQSRTLMAVPLATAPELRVGRPAPVAGSPRGVLSIDAAADGRLLLMYDDRASAAPLTLVEDWTALLDPAARRERVGR